MGMDIDPARGDHEAIGIHRSFCMPRYFSDFNHATVFYGHICSESLPSSAIDQCAAFNDQIMHDVNLCYLSVQGISFHSCRNKVSPARNSAS